MQVLDTVWSALKKERDNMKRADRDEVVFCLEKADRQRFNELYQALLGKTSEHMLYPDKPLDRHKMAAIILLAILQGEVVRQNKADTQERINVLAERIALNVALSFMLHELNEKLEQCGCGKLENFLPPQHYNCRTGYFSGLARSLHFARQDGNHINVFLLADQLFLIERISLLCSDAHAALGGEALLKLA